MALNGKTKAQRRIKPETKKEETKKSGSTPVKKEAKKG
jgi:hypothetical protein